MCNIYMYFIIVFHFLLKVPLDLLSPSGDLIFKDFLLRIWQNDIGSLAERFMLMLSTCIKYRLVFYVLSFSVHMEQCREQWQNHIKSTPLTIPCKRRSYVVYAVKLIPNSYPIKIPILRHFLEHCQINFSFSNSRASWIWKWKFSGTFIPLNLKINFR